MNLHNTTPNVSAIKNPFNIIVIVASLGYFVDIYDLILFGIVKDPSLVELGISDPQQLVKEGAFLLGIQMLGMLDRRNYFGNSRRSTRTTFHFIPRNSPLLYCNSCNGFVYNLNQYAWLRFIAGAGLAGELGVGITLVSEVITKETHGYGTAIVSGVGITGAVLGYIVTKYFGWREAYYVGGGLSISPYFVFQCMNRGCSKKRKEKK
jgi:MFS family permease